MPARANTRRRPDCPRAPTRRTRSTLHLRPDSAKRVGLTRHVSQPYGHRPRHLPRHLWVLFRCVTEADILTRGYIITVEGFWSSTTQDPISWHVVKSGPLLSIDPVRLRPSFSDTWLILHRWWVFDPVWRRRYSGWHAAASAPSVNPKLWLLKFEPSEVRLGWSQCHFQGFRPFRTHL